MKIASHLLPLITGILFSQFVYAQSPATLRSSISASVTTAKPLDVLQLLHASGKEIRIRDGKGREYVRCSTKPVISFRVAGALGTHTIESLSANNTTQRLLEFTVTAHTKIDDGGYYRDMFTLFYKGMFADADAPNGTYPLQWNGKSYQVVVPWVLDNFHTNKGLQYFLPNGKELVDIMREAQREDGMIYSFIQYMPNADYFLTRDKTSGYSKKIGDRIFVRQPTENHPEYIYVNTIYACWKSDGNEEWMRKNLASAAAALNYCHRDPSRWSNRFGLLKRVYTIDSWDFAVEDEYTPDIGITNSMMIDPVLSKFGVFFGDNTGYIAACYQLAEMYEQVNEREQAANWKKQGDEIRDRLNKLSWNGRFFTHFIDEDPSVIRKLGVDEKTQIAQSNAYSLNRNLDQVQKAAILSTYQQLQQKLPVGSPGEWYSIYPPFEKGFETHGAKWQYMNGGVGGHVAGELALGAYTSGFEKYGTDILNRLFELGKKHVNKIWFSYTGAETPAPSKPRFRPVGLKDQANMDITNTRNDRALPWMLSKKPGDDLHQLPTGQQVLAGIPFHLQDPADNQRKAIVAVSRQAGFPNSIEIPINDTVGCFYLLHTAAKAASENIAGQLTIRYTDGTSRVQYLVMEKHLTYWWFSQLKTSYSGIAWYGKNDVSEGIGLSWAAINNPAPGKKVQSLQVEAAAGSGIYTLLGLTVSNQPHLEPVKPTSFGGPDNWAAATAMAGLIEGLAGCRNAAGSVAFRNAVVAPKWTTTPSDSIAVCVTYAGSNAYTAYRFEHHSNRKEIELYLTSSGERISLQLLLPATASSLISVTKGGQPVKYRIRKHEQGGSYVELEHHPLQTQQLLIRYQ